MNENNLKVEDLTPEQRRAVDAALAARPDKYAFYSPASCAQGTYGWIDVPGVGGVALFYDNVAARADWDRRCREETRKREEREARDLEQARQEAQAAAEHAELLGLRAQAQARKEREAEERRRADRQARERREDPRPTNDERREPQYRYGHYGDEDYRVHYQTGMD